MAYSFSYKTINTSFQAAESKTVTLQGWQIVDPSEVLAYA